MKTIKIKPLADSKLGKIRKLSNGSWCFDVSFDGRDFPNFTSAMYKTKTEVKSQLSRYMETGSFDWYGTAE